MHWVSGKTDGRRFVLSVRPEPVEDVLKFCVLVDLLLVNDFETVYRVEVGGGYLWYLGRYQKWKICGGRGG